MDFVELYKVFHKRKHIELTSGCSNTDYHPEPFMDYTPTSGSYWEPSEDIPQPTFRNIMNYIQVCDYCGRRRYEHDWCCRGCGHGW
jgi:hypothetical protein